MKAGQRLWRTAAGGLVPDGHPDAARLAYAAGDDLSAADAEKTAPGEPKQRTAAPNKAALPAANKSR